MPKHIGVEQVEGINGRSDNDEKLEVLIAGLVEVVDAAARIASIVRKGGLSIVADAEVFVFEHHHLGVVGVDQIAYPTERGIEDRHFPSLPIVNLPPTRNDGEQDCLCGIMGFRRLSVDYYRGSDVDKFRLLSLNRDGCHKEKE